MNFHRNSTSNKRSTYVKHHAKAPSAGSTQATGKSRGLFRRALVSSLATPTSSTTTIKESK
jgi:hypothetical protein